MDNLIYSIFEQTNTIVLVLVIIGSLYTLSKGADLFVDEAVSLSVQWGIPKLIVGATIVSLGTTIPEASVSIFSALDGNADLALGNAVGSIITNTSLILGIASLIGNLPIDKKTLYRQGSVLFFSAILLTLISLPVFNNGVTGKVFQWAGWMFLLLLVFYIFLTIIWSKSGTNIEVDLPAEDESKSKILVILKFVVGISIVILSSKILIPAVEIGALRIGVRQSVVASTLIAFGTSVPELITAISAVRKNHGEIAFGNILGANILNILFVIGSSAAISSTGLLVPRIYSQVHYPSMIIILFLVGYFAKNSKINKISKIEGICLLCLYGVYLVLNFN